MTPAIVIGIVVVLAIVAVVVGLELRKQAERTARTHVGLAHLGGFVIRYTWVGPGGIDIELRRALELALMKLQRVWPAERLNAVLCNVHIAVMEQPTWLNGSGVKVAGEAIPSVCAVAVGSDLKALAHELAHLMESGLARIIVDESHAGWTAQGIQAAVDAYEAELG